MAHITNKVKEEKKNENLLLKLIFNSVPYTRGF